MEFTRRQFLRSAGGVTFLALLPVGRGLFAALDPVKKEGSTGPVFTALPYIQHGTSSRLVAGQESMRIAWQTQVQEAEFKVNYGADKNYGRTLKPERAARADSAPGALDGRYNYVATLTGLELGKKYFYQVICDGRTIAEGYLTTRQPRGARIRFASFGDNSDGGPSDQAIAFQTYQVHPDFVMNTGDNVYESGLDTQYSRNFFPVYNSDVAGVEHGAPLLRSVPFYSVMANHDVHAKTEQGIAAADFDIAADSLAYYTNFYFPLNGPAPAFPTPVLAKQNPDRLASFKDCAGARFPQMANYSYDYGDAHFLCLDSNTYMDPSDAGLKAWIEQDLMGTDAAWKFVVFHHPSFNAGLKHYKEQHMRVLSPLLEKCGVDFALHGHEHTYQRTRPMRFAPKDLSNVSVKHKGDRRVPGTFTVDRAFDGVGKTRPDGIIYITTGAGGNNLYDPGFTEDRTKWLHPDDNNVDYVDRFVSDRHSLTVFDLDAHTATLRQIDEYGKEIDRIVVTKG